MARKTLKTHLVSQYTFKNSWTLKTIKAATKTVKGKKSKVNWITKLAHQSADPQYTTTDNQDNAKCNETRNNKRDTGKFEDNNHYSNSNYNGNSTNIKKHSKK